MLREFSVTPTIAVKDMQVARAFYESKLGLSPLDGGNDFVQFFKCGENSIEMYKSDFAGSNKSTALTWGIGDDLESEVKALREKGIQFEHYQMPETRLDGDIHVMKDMKAAWFKDPDGNILCLHDH
jgi:catechol 2,3-dioxygenase-like lactoylglutathione lyase family enzyme